MSTTTIETHDDLKTLGGFVAEQFKKFDLELSKFLVGKQTAMMKLALFIGLCTREPVGLGGEVGLAKTKAVNTTARMCGGTFGRIQGMRGGTDTASVTGYYTREPVMLEQLEELLKQKPESRDDAILMIAELQKLHAKVTMFVESAVYNDFVLFDELTRAGALVLNALIELLEEWQITVEGETRKVHPYFFFTYNPSDHFGTQGVPLAVWDRAIATAWVSNPTTADELMAINQNAFTQSPAPIQVFTMEDLATLRGAVSELSRLNSDDAEMRLAAQMIAETHDPNGPYLRGASPRAIIDTTFVASIVGAINGHTNLHMSDVEKALCFTLPHRVELDFEKLGDERLAERPHIWLSDQLGVNLDASLYGK